MPYSFGFLLQDSARSIDQPRERRWLRAGWEMPSSSAHSVMLFVWPSNVRRRRGVTR